MAFRNSDLNNPKLEARFWAKVDKRGPDECWEWNGATGHNGYGMIRFGRKGTWLRATHISLALAGLLRPDGAIACHKCDNRICVNPSHLWWGNNAENNLDMHRKGRNRQPKGMEHSMRRVTEGQAREIRASSESCQKLARRFNISPTQAWRIRKGHKWRHLA